jgi:uncharacterized membrane protein
MDTLLFVLYLPFTIVGWSWEWSWSMLTYSILFLAPYIGILVLILLVLTCFMACAAICTPYEVGYDKNTGYYS